MPEPRLQLRGQNLDWLEVQNEVVALDGDRSLYLSANRTGALLWAELGRGGATPDRLVDVLRTEFPDLGEQTARQDVDAFLAELRSHDLLVE